MRPQALLIALLTPALLTGLAGPAQAYYPDEHVWDREYQSGTEWGYPRSKRPVPWMPASGGHAAAWQSQGWYPLPETGPQFGVAPGYVPMATDWAYGAPGDRPWDQAAWNTAWWNPAAPLLDNTNYRRAVLDSTTNPFSNQALNQDLAISAAHGELERVRTLIANGADLNARDGEGYTPLTWAAQYGRRDVVEYLLVRFAQPNVVDRWGYTPLMWALQQGHTAVAAALLAHGANPRVANAFGVTPLVLATYAANGVSRPLIDEALAGRPIRPADWGRVGGIQQEPPPQLLQAPVPGVHGLPPQPPAMGRPAPPLSMQPAGPGVAIQPGAVQVSAGGTAWQPPSVTMQAPGLALQPPAPVFQPPAAPPASAPIPLASVAGALEPEPLSVMPSLQEAGVQRTGVLEPLSKARGSRGAVALSGDPEAAWHRISQIAGHFGTTYHQFVLEHNQEKGPDAQADPDLPLGKSLASVFAHALQVRDPAVARTELDPVRTAAVPNTRFKAHIAALDETLRAMGH